MPDQSNAVTEPKAAPRSRHPNFERFRLPLPPQRRRCYWIICQVVAALGKGATESGRGRGAAAGGTRRSRDPRRRLSGERASPMPEQFWVGWQWQASSRHCKQETRHDGKARAVPRPSAPRTTDRGFDDRPLEEADFFLGTQPHPPAMISFDLQSHVSRASGSHSRSGLRDSSGD